MTNPWNNTNHDPSTIKAELAAATETDRALEIDRLRLTAGTALIQALTQLDTAQRAIAELHSPHIYDTALTEANDGRDGQDIAAFIVDSQRYARGAYAIIRRVDDG